MGEPIKEGSLTGTRRYREDYVYGTATNKLNEGLILQVQINTWAQGREDQLGRWVTAWRDATPEDVGKEELCGT